MQQFANRHRKDMPSATGITAKEAPERENGRFLHDRPHSQTQHDPACEIHRDRLPGATRVKDGTKYKKSPPDGRTLVTLVTIADILPDVPWRRGSRALGAWLYGY